MGIQWVAWKTLVQREVVRFVRIWTQTLLPSPVTMILYFLIFGEVVGRKIGHMGGVSYPQFIAPGLIMMGIINNTYSNVSNSFFVSKFARNIEELFVSSMSPLAILMGFSCGAVLRGLCVGLLGALVALFFTHLQVHDYFLLISITLISAFIFALAGLLNAIYAQKFDDINFVPVFIITPLIYLGGTFYTIDSLSPFWQKISQLNPIYSMISVFRYGFFGSALVSLTHSFFFLSILLLVLFGLTYYCLAKGFRIRT